MLALRTRVVIVWLVLGYDVVSPLLQPAMFQRYCSSLLISPQLIAFHPLLNLFWRILLNIRTEPLEIGLLSASAGTFAGPSNRESEVLNVLLDHVTVCHVSTVSHIPGSVWPLLAHVLSLEFQKACSSVWDFVRLLIFARLFYTLLLISLTIAIVILLVSCFRSPSFVLCFILARKGRYSNAL